MTDANAIQPVSQFPWYGGLMEFLFGHGPWVFAIWVSLVGVVVAGLWLAWRRSSTDTYFVCAEIHLLLAVFYVFYEPPYRECCCLGASAEQVWVILTTLFVECLEALGVELAVLASVGILVVWRCRRLPKVGLFLVVPPLVLLVDAMRSWVAVFVVALKPWP